MVPVILTILVVLGLVTYLLNQSFRNNIFSTVLQPTPDSTDEWKWESATKPEWGRLYLTADNNESGIYYTNEEVTKDLKGYSPGLNPYYGKFLGLESHRESNGYYHFLSNPRSFGHDIYIESVGPLVNVIESDDPIDHDVSDKSAWPLKYMNESGLFYGFITWKTDDDEKLQRAVYEIDVKNLSIKKVWADRISKSPGRYGGQVALDSIMEDGFILATVSSCFDCDAEPYGKLIINISTGNDIYLENVTDLDVNLANGTFSYQKLFPVKEKCEPDELSWSSDGMKIIKKPGDQVFTQTLP